MIGLRQILFLFAAACFGQEPVTVTVHADIGQGPFRAAWAYFGYDEPNYTYAPNGQKLIHELSALSRGPVFLRTHNLLTSGDGTAALKWGSTNAYTEDSRGTPVYDWTIVDRIFDTYTKLNAKPFVEIGFMPEALSTKPQPYRHDWPNSLYLGWTYPPKDFTKWAELVRQLALHCASRYGKAAAESWYWEVWNEPDIGYWHGTAEEYNQIYDFAATAVKSVLPRARVGGPATTGPANPKAAQYLRQFLDHCATGINRATGQPGVPLDFITYHAKGSPKLIDGHVQMGIANQLRDVSAGMEIVRTYPKFRDLPILLTESDPEGCAACSARTHPQNAYRNGALYACYTAASLSRILQLADRHKANMEGILTWAFEFEDQPYFDGFRTLSTNGIDKPVLNVFRMAGLMSGDRVSVSSSGAVALDSLLTAGVRNRPDIDGFATRDAHNVSVMIWNYHDDDVSAPDAPLTLRFDGLPPQAQRVEMRHYRIDTSHSNAFTAWRAMGSPQHPDAGQYRSLEAAGRLELLNSPEWSSVRNGTLQTAFPLPRQGVSLVQLSWEP